MFQILIRNRFLICFAVLSLTGCQSTGNGTWKSWFAQRPDGDESSNQEFNSLRPSAADEEIADNRPPKKSPTPRAPIAAERIDILLGQGHTAILDGRHEDARKAFAEVLASDPDNAKAHHGIAIIADISKDWSTAEFHYRQALKQSPRDANLLNDIGYSYYLQSRFHDAENFLNQAASVHPEHKQVQINLARLALRQGNRAGAEERLMSFFPAAEARRHLTMLESQLSDSQLDLASAPPATSSGTVAPATTAELRTVQGPTEPQLPPNVTLEEVRKLAELRRLEAEQLRLEREANLGTASLGTPIPLGPGGNFNSIPNAASSGVPAPDPIVQPGFMTAQNSSQGLTQNPIQTTGYPGNNPGMISQPTVQGLGQPIASPLAVQPSGYHQSPSSSPVTTNQMPLVGLNAGPGALFPVNGSTASAHSFQNAGMMTPGAMNSAAQQTNIQQPNIQQPNPQQPGPQTINNTGANGMYYGPNGTTSTGSVQPMTGLPTTGGMNSVGNSQYPSLPGPVSNPGLVPPQYSIPAQDWARQQQAYADQLNQTSRSTGAEGQVSAPNPLQAYQQQLQSEQSLNQSLDRMNRQSSIAPVQAQY